MQTTVSHRNGRHLTANRPSDPAGVDGGTLADSWTYFAVEPWANQTPARNGSAFTDLLAVGSGFFGLTIAERAAAAGNRVAVPDRRHHVAGASTDFFDESQPLNKKAIVDQIPVSAGAPLILTSTMPR